MRILKQWSFTLVGTALAMLVLGVDRIGTFFLFVPVDKFYVDAVIAVLFFAAGLLLDMNLRKLQREIESEKRLRAANEELDRINRALVDSMAQVRVLSGLLPICANCKKVRDDQGYWQQIEEYIRDHSEADFSHSICPECAVKLYGIDLKA